MVWEEPNLERREVKVKFIEEEEREDLENQGVSTARACKL